jgi:Spy/CpxP family protein refolding chaperone
MKLINSGKLMALMACALFLLTISSPSSAFAQEEQGPPMQGQVEGRRNNPEGDLVRQLNLTPEQMGKIRAIREGNREMRRQVMQRIRATRIALDRAIYVENADESVIEQRARELAEAQGAQIRLQAMTELGVRRILTPEQLQTFLSLRARAENERRNRRRGEQDNEARPQGMRRPRP